ncbi:hypothetical protein [Aeromonas caviae]|uniref:hypothetical protein n=1 Tax=Aeromonas caviae TaxID=648 RepID=UPI001059204A|nr:hypothetical protein [Aeromonas caviae]
MKHQNDHIKFPSGNTVEFCRKKAKKLVKEKGIKLAQALGKVRTSIPRTKNENFSHLISMGYQ